MRYFPSSLLLFLSHLLAVVCSQQPNIVFVLADDYGYHDIGYHGSEIKTPTLDRLAKSGVILENYYVQPICTPTRSQFMSGRYQIHTGLQHNVIHPPQPNGLPPELPTMADKLKKAGYSTHMVGKWHLGFYKQEYCPWNRGFDSYFGYLCGAEDYYRHHKRFHRYAGFDLREGKEPARNYTGHYSASLFTQKAIDVIRNHKGSQKPLFLYLAYQSVHEPMQVPEHYTEPYKSIKNTQRRIYAGMVAAMDEGVKNVTAALQATGQWENTVFVFSTDNGGKPMFGGSNWPLRGFKGTLFDGGLRGVGFVSGGAVPEGARGTVNHQLMHVSDWFPTLVKLGSGGRDVIGDTPLDGFDQWKTITKNTQSPRVELLHNIDTLYPKIGRRHPGPWDTRIRAALRVGDYKMITGDPKNGSWVPVPPEISSFHPKEKNLWLFNITADPEERNDLSEKMPKVVHSMMKRLVKYQESAVPVRFPRGDPKCDPAKHGGFWGPWA